MVKLNFTPLGFETLRAYFTHRGIVQVKFYSFGVWNDAFSHFAILAALALNFTPLEFETQTYA